MRHASIVYPLALTLLAGVPLTADARPKKGAAKKSSPKQEAKVHTDKAAKAHKAGKFDEALTELQAAYALDPEPKLLFAIAQVQQKLDRCGDAIPNYEKFLEATKDKQKQAVVKQAISACQDKLAAAPPTTPPPTTPEPAITEPPPPTTLDPAPVTPPPATHEDSPFASGPTRMTEPTPPPHSSAKPWYKDALGDALVLGGVAAGAVSIVMYTGARSSLDDAEAATSLPAYDDLVDKAHDKRMYAVISGGAAVVLIGAGLLHYKFRDKGESRGVAIAPARGGGLITWTGGF